EPDPERVLQTQRAIVDALAALPSVGAVGFTSSMPMDGFNIGADVIYAEDQRDVAPDAPQPLRRFKYVSPGLLGAAGTRLVAGRDLSWSELDERRSVVLLSESLARELWGTPQAALGKRILGGRATASEVVGVVQDVRDN